MSRPPAGRPATLRVARGNPSPEELAVVTAVLLARAGVLPGPDPVAADADQAARPPGWNRPPRTAHRLAASWRTVPRR